VAPDQELGIVSLAPDLAVLGDGLVEVDAAGQRQVPDPGVGDSAAHEVGELFWWRARKLVSVGARSFSFSANDIAPAPASP
jgi:hypothetical protein